MPLELNSDIWGDGDIFANLAAGHHKPETPMQWAVAVADRVSSGWDRDTFENEYNRATHWKDFKKTRLLPVLEELSFKEKKSADSTDAYQYRYPLAPVSPKTIFPGLKEDIVPENRDTAAAEYKALFEKFAEGLKHLSHREENIELWFEHFESLVMLYASHIPAARVGNVVPDVSLYDHLRTTAALAASIYLYHLHTDTFSIEAIKSYRDNKFLLINGDFRGIQNFIFSKFSQSEKFRSKILRGRSLAVSLLSELSADMLCREIGLPFTSIVLNAAGRFTIIAPNTEQTEAAIKSVEKRINDWLVKSAFGETVINIATQKASGNDFVSGNFSNLWDQFCLRMEEKKFSSIDMNLYGGVVEGYLDSFVNEPGKPAICPFCGKRPAVRDAGKYLRDDLASCNFCRDHIFLGSEIVKKSKMAITTIDADTGGTESRLFEPVFGKYQVSFYENKTAEMARRGQLLKYWNLSTEPGDFLRTDLAVKCISGYVPKYGKEDENDDRIISSKKSEKNRLENIDQINIGDPKTLNHLACMAKTEVEKKYTGIEALGVLKADVDHLGLLMACGLQEKRFTLSRLATLSRQLNYYFAVYLPHFLENQADFNNIYTVFAGGDDLFLIGPWNSIIKLASTLSESFADYVCQNHDIHFSAGITLHKPHTPVDTMAESVEEAIEKSKSEGRNRLTLFSETAKWENIKKLLQVEREFEEWLDRGWISRVMFYRLNEFIKMAAREKQVVSNKEIDIRDMACTKWRSMLVYTTERNIAGKIKDEERRKKVEEITSKLTGWLDLHGSNLRISLWKILYNRR